MYGRACATVVLAAMGVLRRVPNGQYHEYGGALDRSTSSTTIQSCTTVDLLSTMTTTTSTVM